MATSCAYGTDGNLLAKASAGTVEAYVYALGKLVGYERIAGMTRARYYTATDSLGSVTGTTDQGGALVGRREYADFGSAGMDGEGNEDTLAWYTGKEWDGEAGLYYFNARWYEPETGRFTTEDPVRDKSNWYIYCENNPLGRIDQTGLGDGDALVLSGFGNRRASAGAYEFVSMTNESTYFEIGVYTAKNLPKPTLSGACGPLGSTLGYLDKSTSEMPGEYVRTAEFTIANKHNALVSKPNEAIFYAGNTDGVFASLVAKEIAKETGGTTIEMLIEEKGVAAPPLDDDPAWRVLSREMARNVSGDVIVVLGDNVRENSTWDVAELPALEGNKRIRTITAIDPKTKERTVIYTREKGETAGMTEKMNKRIETPARSPSQKKQELKAI